jgi:SOS-response transcriptional repressor LexA
MPHRLAQLKKFYRRFRRLPSFSEMLDLFTLNSKNAVYKIVQKFIEQGYIKKENNIYAPTSKFFALPLLGIVKAGFPIIADEDKNYLTLDEFLIEDPNSSFLFRVSGDSLSGIGVFDGDIVIIEKKKEAYPGDIVLAEIDREWTLKILKRNKTDRILYLEAANPKYPPLYPSEQLQIFGVVKALVRKLQN